jgi:NAD(P)-dependent dehydrogenase (short-subunit alcohol dehydrogenase family)
VTISRVDRVVEALGGVHILLNDAGICQDEPAECSADESSRRVLDLNLDGTFSCSRVVGRVMLEAGRGSTVNIASMFVWS